MLLIDSGHKRREITFRYPCTRDYKSMRRTSVQECIVVSRNEPFDSRPLDERLRFRRLARNPVASHVKTVST
jgi:hypothetical protein